MSISDEERSRLWKRVHADIAAYGNDASSGSNRVFVHRRSISSPQIIPLIEKCEQVLASTEPPASFDPITISILIAAVPTTHAYIKDLLGGPVYFEAVLESLRYALRWEGAEPPGYIFQPSVPALIAPLAHTWLPNNFLQANIAQCKKIADARWPAATVGERWTIASVFRADALGVDYSRSVVAQILAETELPIGTMYICEIVRDVAQAEAIIARDPNYINYDALALNLKSDAFPLLIHGLAVPKKARAIAQSLAKIDDRRVADAFIDCLGRRPLRPIAAAYFERGTEAGKAALLAAASKKSKSKVTQMAQDLLARVARVEQSVVADQAAAQIPEASLDELPPLIAKPSWWGAPPVIDNVGHANLLDRLLPPIDVEPVNVDPVVAAREEALLTADEKTAATDQVLLERWAAGGFYASKRVHTWGLQRLGARAIDTFDKVISYAPELVLAIDSPRIATLVAGRAVPVDWRQISQTPCPYAVLWLRRFPVAAVLGLVPHTNYPYAARVLRSMRRQGVDIESIVREHYSEAIAKTVMKSLAIDPDDRLPKAVPVVTGDEDGVPLETITRPRLKSNGKRLPLEQLRGVLQLIAFSDTRYPHPGIAIVRDTFEPKGLAEMSWDLACAWELRQKTARRAWRRRQANEKYLWLLSALVHFADEDIVRRLTPRFNGPEMVEVLGQIRTDAALLELLTIFAREKDKKDSELRPLINTQLVLAAAMRGLTADELEETILPDPIRVGATVIDGRPVIDYGPRHFEVRWSEDLTPALVVDDANRTAPVSRRRGGKKHTSKRLPATRKTDVPEKIEAAKKVWATIVEDVAAVIARRVELLSRAMDESRSWTLIELRKRYIDPPLLAHLARGVLFVREGDPGAKAFRVAEDGSFANVDDATCEVAESDRIRLIKPADLSADEVTRWRSIFFDYGLIMPVAQLPAFE